jgi:hypothetical protein
LRVAVPVAVLLVGMTGSGPARSQGAEFAGRWVIAGAVIAPWADPPGGRDDTEEKRLVGRTVTFGARSVAGPEPLGCGPARYKTRTDPPDMIFEGALADPHGTGKPVDARPSARSLGMTTATVRTLETGCSEVSFHRFAPDTLVFGLNDRVYTMHRDTGRPARGNGS